MFHQHRRKTCPVGLVVASATIAALGVAPPGFARPVRLEAPWRRVDVTDKGTTKLQSTVKVKDGKASLRLDLEDNGLGGYWTLEKAEGFDCKKGTVHELDSGDVARVVPYSCDALKGGTGTINLTKHYCPSCQSGTAAAAGTNNQETVVLEVAPAPAEVKSPTDDIQNVPVVPAVACCPCTIKPVTALVYLHETSVAKGEKTITFDIAGYDKANKAPPIWLYDQLGMKTIPVEIEILNPDSCTSADCTVQLDVTAVPVVAEAPPYLVVTKDEKGEKIVPLAAPNNKPASGSKAGPSYKLMYPIPPPAAFAPKKK